MSTLGERLAQLCALGHQQVVLVAPFIKVAAFERLLANISSSVEVRCVTRWRPEEVISGVSDLEVWPLLRDRPGSELWLRPDLHAKYFRVDQCCLVGSANITASALGWSNQSNLELLVSMKASEPSLSDFEATLLRDAVQVDEAMHTQMAETVRLIRQQYPALPPFLIPAITGTDSVASQPTLPVISLHKGRDWLPTLRDPEALYLAYIGKTDQLTGGELEAASFDLQELAVIPGLSQAAFRTYIGSLLLQKPIIRRVDMFVDQPRRFGAVRDLLASTLSTADPSFDASRSWQTLMRWLLYFLPNRYCLLAGYHSEVFQRVFRTKDE